jgi:hypothetical protein
MNPQNQPQFEERVLKAAGAALDAYLARTKGRDGGQVLVQVLVRSVVPLSPGGNQAIRELLEEIGHGAVLQVRLEITTGLPDGFEIRCEPISDAGSWSAHPPRPSIPTGEGRLLTVSYNGLRFDYLLASGPEWWPLARPDDRRAGGQGFLLPQSMSSVPGGFLLELRLDGETLLARRTWQRHPEITMALNDAWLHPAHHVGVPIPPRGRITYWYADGNSCSLDYTLTDWKPARLSPAGRPDLGDGGNHLVALTVDNQTFPLDIVPPKPTDRAVERKFPIPAATSDGRPYYLDVQVLYTSGIWCDPASTEWHVKIYRCATPQHADQLRRYLRTQASLVGNVNAAVGGTGQAPPWAIAPVTVLPLGSVPGGPLPTELDVDPEVISADPENRLSAWFGVPEQPQPHSFLIVVSPMLKKVGWAPSSLRANAPGIDQLADLKTLATGLDRCHKLGIAHCDIKPENVCRNVRAAGGSGYVLIDGDAVSRTHERLVALRLTLNYASPRITRQWRQSYDGNTVADVREHDRFGFALVVLAAVAGADRVAALLVLDEHGGRPVDNPEIVRTAIESYWPARWSRFAEALASPFRENALVGDDWKAVDWLDWLDHLSRPEVVVPPTKTPTGPVFNGMHAAHLAQIRAEVRASPRGLNAWVPAVLDRLAAHQLLVARAAYWRTVRMWGLLPLPLVILLLVVVIVGSR